MSKEDFKTDEVGEDFLQLENNYLQWKKSHSYRYFKLAQQWYQQNNLLKAKEFAKKSYKLHKTQQVKQFLKKINVSKELLEEENNHELYVKPATTTTKGEYTTEIAIWLNQNNLSAIANKMQQSSVTVPELFKATKNDIKELCKIYNISAADEFDLLYTLKKIGADEKGFYIQREPHEQKNDTVKPAKTIICSLCGAENYDTSTRCHLCKRYSFKLSKQSEEEEEQENYEQLYAKPATTSKGTTQWIGEEEDEKQSEYGNTNQIEYHHKKENMSEITKWLHAKNLSSIATKLEKSSITLAGLMTGSKADIKELCEEFNVGTGDRLNLVAALRNHIGSKIAQNSDEQILNISKKRQFVSEQQFEEQKKDDKKKKTKKKKKKDDEEKKKKKKKGLCKIALLGNSGVGKTVMIERFISNKYVEHMPPTITADLQTTTKKIGDWTVTANIWDTAGVEQFYSLTKIFYKNAHAIILVYDITSRESFDNLSFWNEEIKKHAPSDVLVCLVGSKSDLDQIRKVFRDEGKKKAAQLNNCIFCGEVSAKTAHRVDQVFEFIMTCIIAQNTIKETNAIDIAVTKKKKKKGCKIFG